MRRFKSNQAAVCCADVVDFRVAATVVSGFSWTNQNGYYGVYLVYPGLVFHHQLTSLAGQTTSFKRFVEFNGPEITLKFPPGLNQGREVRTIVTLKRLSDAADMLGESR